MITARSGRLQAATRPALRRAVLLMAGLGLAGEALSAQPRAQRGQPRSGASVAQAMVERAMTGSSVVERILRMGDRLNLSAEQREQLEAMRAQGVEARAARAAQWMEMSSEIRAGLRERADAREAIAQVREEAATELRTVRTRLEEVLTDEQRRQVRAFVAVAALRSRDVPGRTGRGWRGGRGGRGREIEGRRWPRGGWRGR